MVHPGAAGGGRISFLVLSLIFKFVISQLIALIVLPVGFVVFVVNHILIRHCLGLYLFVRYGGKVKLVGDSGDAMFGYKSEGNTRNILITIEMDRMPDINYFVQRFERDIIQKKVGRKRPYEKLKWIFTKTCGYFSWTLDDHFDCKNHFLVIEEGRKVTEDRLQEILSQSRHDMTTDHPQWQFLFIPHFVSRQNEGSEVETSSVIVRFHHAILDGLSFVLFVSHCLGVAAAPSSSSNLNSNVDPGVVITDTPSHATFPYILNPLTFQVPLKYRVINNINCILFGFYHLLTTLLSTSKHWLMTPDQNGDNIPYPGDTKNYDCSANIESSTLRTIRRSCKVSVASILASCFLRALENVVGSRLPDEVTVGHSLAFLPYPDPFFNNRFTLLSVSTQKSLHRLLGSRRDKVKAYHRQNNLALQGPEPSLYYWFFQFYGKLPAPFFKFVLKQPRFSFFLNNLPFSKEQLTIWNRRILTVKGWPPYTTDAGIGVTSVGYCDQIFVGVTADTSWLTKDELRLAMMELEKEIHILAKECSEDMENGCDIVV